MFLLGSTDENGKFTLPSTVDNVNSKLLFHKLGYRDTVVIEGLKEICLMRQSVYLEPIDVVASKKNHTKKIFEKFIRKSISNMSTTNKKLFYSFKVKIEVPDSNWLEVRTGVLQINLPSYSKRQSDAHNAQYCELSVKIDSSMWYSNYLESIVRNRLLSFLNVDHMRKKSIFLKRWKSLDVIQSDNSNQLEFSLESPSNIAQNRVRFNIKFNSDSLISSCESIWLKKTDVTTKITSWYLNSSHIYLSYIEESNSFYDSLYVHKSYFNKDKTFSTFELSMKLVPSFQLLDKKVDSCLNESIFLDISPSGIKGKNIELKVE